jgi:hypothetical protein
MIIQSMYKLFPDTTPKLHPEYERGRDEVINPGIRRGNEDSQPWKGFTVQKRPTGEIEDGQCTTKVDIVVSKVKKDEWKSTNFSNNRRFLFAT